MFYPRAWPWGWLVYSLEGNYASILAIAATVSVANLFCGWTLDSKKELVDETPVGQRSDNKSSSFRVGSKLFLSVLTLWQGSSFLGTSDSWIVSPGEVAKAMLELLVTKSTAFANGAAHTIWTDIGLSLFNIIAGIGIGALLAIVAVKLLTRFTTLKLSSFALALTSVAPVGLATLIISWVGVGAFYKILLIVCFVFYPLAQALWFHRSSPPMAGILLSVAEGLPFAFLGMVFSEAMAATAGLGFLMIVFPATGKLAEATATGLIVFALLVISSTVLRFTARQLLRPTNP